MRIIGVFVRIGLVACVLLGGSAAVAGPVRCSVNNQDSTCVGHLTTAWQTAPTCPNQPGWTTIAAAQWIGSQYSAPHCNYQAPPTCPSGFNQTSAPAWDGDSWVGLGCAVPPPAPPAFDPVSVCQANFPAAQANGVFDSIQSYVGDVTNNAALVLQRSEYPSDTLYGWNATGSNGCDSGGQITRGSVICAINPAGRVDAVFGLFSQGACHPH
ncbi:hypothetical protein B0G71_7629 [Paraburkholderia sp. BL27I4N3]|nr:hypothetical protein B0G71_7629 [Paraburkholderia sp. BL27I4N3]